VRSDRPLLLDFDVNVAPHKTIPERMKLWAVSEEKLREIIAEEIGKAAPPHVCAPCYRPHRDEWYVPFTIPYPYMPTYTYPSITWSGTQQGESTSGTYANWWASPQVYTQS